MKNFLEIPQDKIIEQNECFFIIKDTFPVSPGHLLIISNKMRSDFFSLTNEEKSLLSKSIDRAKELIELDFKPDGYNIGMNCGESAGQTVFHFHCHVIPRYIGDMENPRGGVRHSINGKGYY
ncbi:HIT family protein [Flavobacterium ovatum]|uniref:HIT family protein n=1 Tax=Flavobacterium ovatum TaxID=1928857 RepID=UPI00344B39E3